MRSRISTKTGAVLATGAALALTVGLASVLGEERNLPVDFTHNVMDAPAPVAGAVFGTGPALHAGDRICTTVTQTTANVDTDCEKTGPTNETSIAVNPTNENNIIGGTNDYQLGLNPGGHVARAS